MNRILDIGASVTIVATFVLFLIAAVVKGFTRELLLEAGVFLVSLKLIISTAKQSIAQREVIRRLDSIDRQLASKSFHPDGNQRGERAA